MNPKIEPQSGRSFFHGGATGDTIYALPTIEVMGGGDLYLRLPEHLFIALKPLLLAQPYIRNVYWRHLWDAELKAALPDDCIDLDLFRKQPCLHLPHLCQLHLDAQGVSGVSGIKDDSWKHGWLTLPPIDDAPAPAGKYAVINRTPRYNDPHCDWRKEIGYLYTLADKIYFLGLESGYKTFTEQFGDNDIEYMPTADYLTATYIIQYAVMFTGNQSSLLAVAEGLGIPYRMEQAPGHTNCNLFVPREKVINTVSV